MGGGGGIRPYSPKTAAAEGNYSCNTSHNREEEQKSKKQIKMLKKRKGKESKNAIKGIILTQKEVRRMKQTKIKLNILYFNCRAIATK